MSLEKRFWAKVDRRSDDECWEWTACKNSDGYGSIYCEGRMLKAHRVSWEINVDEIPDGMDVLHHCDNPSCVNPTHLFVGTKRDNMLDAYAKGRKTQIGERNGFSILTRKQVIQIKKGVSNAEFKHGDKSSFARYWADEFNVSFECVRSIVNNYSWTHIKVSGENNE